MEMKLTIRKDKVETVYKTDTRTISWKTFGNIVQVFDVKNLLTALPVVLKNLDNIKSDKIKESVKTGEIEEMMPILDVVVNICLNSMDKIVGILAECFEEYNLTEEEIAKCDFDEILTCVISLLINVGQILGLLIQKKTK